MMKNGETETSQTRAEIFAARNQLMKYCSQFVTATDNVLVQLQETNIVFVFLTIVFDGQLYEARMRNANGYSLLLTTSSEKLTYSKTTGAMIATWLTSSRRTDFLNMSAVKLHVGLLGMEITTRLRSPSESRRGCHSLPDMPKVVGYSFSG